MKQLSFFALCSIIVCLLVSSCSDSETYAESLKKEKELISSFIDRNHIQVRTSLPAKGETWTENEYYLNETTGVYFHLVSKGNTTVESDSVESGDEVVTRYKAYTLQANPDSTILWSELDASSPEKFTYMNTTESCLAFHEAVSYMKYSDSEAKIIVPSKKGLNDDMLSVTPMFYYLKIRIKK